MSSLLLLLSLPSALAAEPAIPTPAMADEHLVDVAPFNGKAEDTVLAIVMECWPSDTQGPLKYTKTVQGFAADAHAAADALSARNDTRVVKFFNPTPAEFDATMDTLRAELGDDGRYAKLNFLYIGLAKGGDTNDEVALCPGGGIPWTKVAVRMKTLSDVSIGVLDASRDVSESTSDLGPTLGFTANDWRDAGMPDGFAISAGPEGKYTGPGLVAAFTKVVADSKGGTLSMGDIVLGLRTNAPLLELGFSTGSDPKDQWTDNLTRQVFPGGGLRKPTVALPKDPVATTKRRIPPGWILLGGGVAAGGVASIFAVQASASYDTLVAFNQEGAPSDTVLNDTADDFRANMATAIIVGGIGTLGVIGGGTWLVVDQGQIQIGITPTGNGAVLSGKFR